MNYIQYMQKGKPFPFAPEQVQEGTLRVNPETNRTQTYHNGEWQDNVITTPWSSGETVRDNNGQQEVYLDGKWRALRDPKWYENIKEEDWYTLGSIAGDLAGVGLGAFGLSVPAAVSGMASTTSQLIGDIKRDGFQAKDLGWAALGYGLDAATFIPGLGELAQTAKLSKKVATYAPYILKTFGGIMSGIGMASALPALEKATRGEKLTIDDYRSLTNGLMGIIGLKNTFSSQISQSKNSEIDPQTPVPSNKPTTADRLQEQEIKANEFFTDIQNRHLAQQQQLKQQQRNFESTGYSKGDRNRVVKPNPLAGTAPETALQNLMLINRVGTSQIEWQNGVLTWPQQKIPYRTLFDNTPSQLTRPTVHFTTHQSVMPHNSGSWNGSPTTIMFPYAEAVRNNGMPLNIEPMDTWFSNATSFRIPANKILVFTGDLAEATRARLQGADVTFSSKVGVISKRIQAIDKEIDALHRIKGGYDIPEYNSPEYIKIKNLSNEKDELEKQMRQLHEDFIQSHQTAPTYEDYMQLEKETGLISGVGTHENPVGFGEKQFGGLTYSHDPRTHSGSWYGTTEHFGPVQAARNYIFQLDNYVFNPYEGDLKWVDVNQKSLLNPQNLVLFQQNVQKALKEHPNEIIKLRETIKTLSDDMPYVQELKRILNGELVYKYYLGGKLNYLNYFQHE